MKQQVKATSWWLLALSLIFVASNSGIFGVLFAVVAAIGLTVAGNTRAKLSTAFRFYLRLALVVLITRVLFRVIFSYSGGDDVFLALPSLKLELGALGSINFLGNISTSTMLSAITDGLRLAAIILAIGMANSISDVRELIRSLPAALSEIGLSISIALNLVPQLVSSINRVRQAQKLRGRSSSLKALAGFVIPVLEDAIDRSMMLAASMDSRGFGRTAFASTGIRRANRVLMLTAGLSTALAFAQLVLVSDGATGGLILVSVSILATALLLALNSKIRRRTRYRAIRPTAPDFAIYLISLLIIAANLAGVIS